MNLTDDIKLLKGIGEKKAEIFYSNGIFRLVDFLRIFPRKYLSHEHAIPVSKLKTDEYVTVFGKVMSSGMQFGRKKRFTVHISDGSGILKAVWFNYINYVQGKIKKGMTVALTGKVNYFSGYQIVHPEIEIISENEEKEHKKVIFPVYSIPENLRKNNVTSNQIKKFIEFILPNVSRNISETIPAHLLAKHGLPSFFDAMEMIHFPKILEESDLGRARFKFEELFHIQLYLLLKKQKNHHIKSGSIFEKVGENFHKIHDSLPYELTDAQKRVIKEIRRDQKLAVPMNRLVQGDVGSGKTVVAQLCMAIAVDNNFQTALMAPTEILAEQHYLNTQEFADIAGFRIKLLTGSLSAKEKREALGEIQNGEIDIVIGTHAVIQENVIFKNLGFIVIDEQHRFGVLQRAKLQEKGENPHVLVMTATPIPRTLALTVYGDLDVSVINELPKGRKEIKTYWFSDHEEDKAHRLLIDKLRAGEQTYIVFPLIEESEKLDLKAAEDGYNQLKNGILSPFRVGLLHGRMKAQEKEQVMADFKAHKLDVLISTTVIEVGVDVPNATVMLIENANRFGLTQLHQLRGRVGRGGKKSLCILKTPYAISSDARERMTVMVETTDGFRIAEEDMRIRGIGEIFGTKQSGFSDLQFANLATDQIWLIKAREEAMEILKNDPNLAEGEHQYLKNVVKNVYQKKFGLIGIA